ncbi:MAG: sigma-54-dependent transcriptional regulator [Thiotrichales bacterium]
MDSDAATILIVDDDPLSVDLLEQELAESGYRTRAVRSGEEALALAAGIQPDLVLLDILMRGIDGYETCQRLKRDEATRATPVIFLTALVETFDKVRAFRSGGVDYVTKPFDSEELLARVATHLALRREIEAHRRSRATIRLLIESGRPSADAMIGESLALRRVREQLAQVAPTDSTVLIQGETGTGKELVANAIHASSHRRERPLIVVNCAALPRELVESTLFGHEKGAFTGAMQQRRGRFELADGATLLLDEIGELPLEAQAKLLRVLQNGAFERVGGIRTLHSDVRIIAATNRDLAVEVRAGRFRADLYYRLDVFPLRLPPLRERLEDLPDLVRYFIANSARKLGRPSEGVAAAIIAQTQGYHWPGNIRELENLVERALIAGQGGFLARGEAFESPVSTQATPLEFDADATLEVVERTYIRRVLERVRWQIEGTHGAARRLGLNPSTLRGRMRKLGIRRTS